MYDRHEASHGVIAAPIHAVFDLLDDHARLSAHMSVRSWRMGWGKVDSQTDTGRFRAQGSRLASQARFRPPAAAYWRSTPLDKERS